MLLNRKKLLADSKRLGRWGERRCEKFLKKKGFKLLVRNFFCKTGEIDLIMFDIDGGIVFVEVKTRADEVFTPTEDVVTQTKTDRMFRTARHFLSSHNIVDKALRFDFVTVILGSAGPVVIRHYENAFTP